MRGGSWLRFPGQNLNNSVQWFDSQQQNGYSSSAKPMMDEIKKLCFVQLLKLDKTKHLCFLDCMLYSFDQ